MKSPSRTAAASAGAGHVPQRPPRRARLERDRPRPGNRGAAPVQPVARERPPAPLARGELGRRGAEQDRSEDEAGEDPRPTSGPEDIASLGFPRRLPGSRSVSNLNEEGTDGRADRAREQARRGARAGDGRPGRDREGGKLVEEEGARRSRAPRSERMARGGEGDRGADRPSWPPSSTARRQRSSRRPARPSRRRPR